MEQQPWPKFVITAIIAGLAGIVATHQTLGVRVSSIEVEVSKVSRSLDRIEAAFERIEIRRGDRLPAERDR